ncbi:MAG: M28 family peptidase [Treponema sp.]|nr:M28 family peptidase [Treponema sp.]
MFDLESFSQFISPDADRGAFIQNYLLERGVQSAVINVDGRRHIYAKFPPSGYSANFRIKTLIAHYDRFSEEGKIATPGANDNSSSVFCLMDFAARLVKFKGVHNVRIFFTDGEELVSGRGGVTEQGAYKLANVIQKAGIRDEDVFVFDCVGRGMIPVLGTAAVSNSMNAAFSKKCVALENGAKAILSSLGIGWLNLPIPYSDNAGFLASGIPAVALTMLPGDEAQSYMLALQKIPRLSQFVRNPSLPLEENEKAALKKILPKTWQLFHTPEDNLDSLTPASFDVVAKILDVIAARKTM